MSRHWLPLFTLALTACSSSNSPGPPTTTSSSGNSSTSSSSSGGGGGDALSGSLGDLGAVAPVVSSLWISNSGETLVYLSTGAITCEMLTESRWLGKAEANSQVIEIVISGKPAVGDKAVPPGEVNYAAGGKSSSYEVNAKSGTISFTKVDTTTLEGTVTATYAKGSVSGPFSATFCDGGQDW